MLARVLLFGLLSLPGLLLADTLRLGGMVRCPYVCADDEHPGFILEITEEILERAGHKVLFEPLPWSRALRYVRSNNLDGIVGVLRRNAPDLVYPKLAQAVSQYVFFVPANSSWQHTGLVSLWQVNIGVTQDLSYGSMDSYIQRYKHSPRIQSLSGVTAVNQNLRAMELGRIDAVLADRVVMDYRQLKDPLSFPLKEAGSLHAEYLYVAFASGSSEATEYARILSDGLDRLRADGTLDTILQRYGLSDWLGNSPEKQARKRVLSRF